MKKTKKVGKNWFALTEKAGFEGEMNEDKKRDRPEYHRPMKVIDSEMGCSQKFTKAGHNNKSVS